MLIKVKASTLSKEDKVVKKNEDSFEVFVKAEAQRNMANKRIIELLAEYFDLPQHKVKIIKGFKESNKIFDIKYE
ncbi:MAG: DUF167 family protein [Candidatus Pacebacteria bacterium]|nr:DUF167 family protein [Candidatus Paceibacterota bacterium]MDD2757002.1 DUF167 family protein [Candidatus Paceibacterota bacterium]MDD3283512.1 DUF167 family protein [Candidatus Paceibacterota bacterium]MDD3969632.1 DUF167 family protein [Candidatus Paceibacterota bacterium]MDD4738028.1 DUF167 family protein [Candidatus Paceibacterota bacterium]